MYTARSFKAIGYSFDPTTRAWTTQVVYEARDRMEAIRWCNFNRDWLQRLSVVEVGQPVTS